MNDQVRVNDTANDTTCTCRYCRLPIEPGRGVYVEWNFEVGQMGWFHSPICRWHQEAAWREYNQQHITIADKDGTGLIR